MRQARNQLILLGFLCQGLTWDDYLLPLASVVLWVACLSVPPGRVRLPPLFEGLMLLMGSLAGLELGHALGHNTHFFLGHGITLLQASRLLRPLNRREQALSIIMAGLQLAVGCTFLFDLRFLPILAVMLVLLPRTLQDLADEPFSSSSLPTFPRPGWGAHAVIMAVAVLFFIGCPRGRWGGPMPFFRSGMADTGSLLDSVLDPRRRGVSGSSRVLLQIQGERLGYLRCYALEQFDGVRWSAVTVGRSRPLGPIPAADQRRLLHRRVQVKQVSFLGRVLPTDGRVRWVTGSFFLWPLRNTQDAIECGQVWNAGKNGYEYWIDPQPSVEPFRPGQLERLMWHPPVSARLTAWLETALAGETQPLRQARLLESRLQRDFTYQLGGPELNRLNPIEDFLFQQKSGHCERFASTLALLLRMTGIPARVVIGYLPRRQGWLSNGYLVRFNDAHAWTEAFFPETGWAPLDATPAASLVPPGNRLSEWWDAWDLAWSLHVVNYDGNSQQYLGQITFQGLGRVAQWTRLHAVILLAGLAALGLGLTGLRFRLRPRAAARASAMAPPPARHAYDRMLRLLARQGFPRHAAQTPGEFASEVRRRRHRGAGLVGWITEQFCRWRYGQHPLDALRQARLRHALERLERLESTTPGGKPRVTPSESSGVPPTPPGAKRRSDDPTLPLPPPGFGPA